MAALAVACGVWCAAFCGPARAAAAAQEAPADEPGRSDGLAARIAEQQRQLDQLRRLLAAQEEALDTLRRSVTGSRPSGASGASAANGTTPTPARSHPAGPAVRSEPAAEQAAEAAAPAAAAPRPAPIFEQPGVLTPRGRYSLEPSLQYAYSSSNRVALLGYTVVPALLVGLIDVREVKRSTWTGALAWRYGLTQRLEIEARQPYVHRFDTSIGREVLQGTSSNTSSPFDARGQGVGDAEMTLRLQLNAGAPDEAYYVGSLRVKTRTGKDPFEAMTSTQVQGFRGEGVQTDLPTGSGFYGVQPALTALFPSDPAVFFGTLSYLHSVPRKNVLRRTDQGPEAIGDIRPGGIFGFNFGMGIALNEKSSFSIGYDHSSVGKTRVNGSVAADSVRLQLGTLLLGYSHRLDDRRSVNLSLGAGLTRDTPDVSLTLRLPVSN